MATVSTEQRGKTGYELAERDSFLPDQSWDTLTSPTLSPAVCAIRREYIYPHRSVRCFPISGARLFAAFGIALLMSVTIFYFGSVLLAAHGELSGFILRHTAIGTVGERMVEVFPHLGTAIARDIPFPHPGSSPLRTGLLLVASVFVLAVIHRGVPLSRNFVMFVLVLLGTSAGVIILNPSFHFDSVMYQQIWLRGEILVWILLPWVSAFLFSLSLPSLTRGVAWALLVQVYAMVWSAFRLAFCLGVLHYTGILFLPVLWFCLGLLFDLAYVLVFYSLALRTSIKQTSGERES